MVRFCTLFATCLLVFAGCSILSPVPPEAPAGPASGVVGISQLFSAITTDRQGDSIAYRFDWGDGTMSDWGELAASGTRISLAHVWELPGEHAVRVRARDKGGHLSAWSLPHQMSITSYAGYPDSVLQPVEAGKDPVGIAAGPDGEYLYVAARGDDEVRVIRSQDLSLVARIPVGTAPHAVCVLPNGQYAYVANSKSDNVSVIQLKDNRVVATVPVQEFPIYCCPSPNSRAVFVSNYGSGSVSVIGTSDNTVKATVPVGDAPWGIAATPDGSRVYVGLSGTGKLKKLSTKSPSIPRPKACRSCPAVSISTPRAGLRFPGRWTLSGPVTTRWSPRHRYPGTRCTCSRCPEASTSTWVATSAAISWSCPPGLTK
jgi:YVTN family beta-propeller protein